MSKKDVAKQTPEPADDKAYQAAIEEKVRQMLDPEIKDPEPVRDSITTAPVLNDAEISTDGISIEKSDEPVSIDTDADKDDIVDQIVAEESDALLQAEDEKIAAAFEDKKLSKMQIFRQAWSDWWHNPLKRRATLAIVALTLLSVFAVPPSRYFVLNTVGVRSNASMIILDDSTQQPLKNVTVVLGNKSAQTNNDGKVNFSKLRLGRQTMQVKKRAFAELNRSVTIGWGSNPLGALKISPTGSQYNFEITDYLSGKPLGKIEAVSGDFNAQSDEAGLIKLTIEETDEAQTVEVRLRGQGYREEVIALNLDDSQDMVKQAMVPAQQHVFVSRRSGKYDIYKIDADGKNETKILSGSGTERSDLVLVPHPTNGFVALVSTRENVRNQSGFLLSTLTLIEPDQASPTKVAQSERIQIIDWVKDRLVYVQIAEGASASSPKRHRLMSYDLETGKSNELATANFFNDVISVNGTIYYAPSAAYSTEAPGLFKIAADGSSKQTVIGEEVWNVFRTDYDKLVLASGTSWYEYVVSSNKSTKLSGEPGNLSSRIYIQSPNHEKDLWIDQRDGKGVLIALDAKTKEEKVLHERSGLQNPIFLLNDSSVVFRVSTSQETADYVMSLDGGEPRKLKDVTNTAGIDRWYFY